MDWDTGWWLWDHRGKDAVVAWCICFMIIEGDLGWPYCGAMGVGREERLRRRLLCWNLGIRIVFLVIL